MENCFILRYVKLIIIESIVKKQVHSKTEAIAIARKNGLYDLNIANDITIPVALNVANQGHS